MKYNKINISKAILLIKHMSVITSLFFCWLQTIVFESLKTRYIFKTPKNLSFEHIALEQGLM